MRKKYLWWSLVIWSFVVIASFVSNYYRIQSSNKNLVLNKSRAFIEQILNTREWNAEHGGVYVPIMETTLPNIYLEDSLRDIVTTSGLRLTKVNPAYMTRQIAEMSELKDVFKFHITSLNPIRPENKADEWETKSLKMFERGVTENIELITNDSISQYRYMAPLITETSCLECHAKQGYKYGDIRGGISISMAEKQFAMIVNKQIISLGIIHLVVLIVGIMGLWIYFRMTNKYLLIIENRNNELAQINATKDKIFSIIGHDLQAPFNSILGYSEILVEHINKKNYDSIENYSNIIHDSSQRVSILLNNLLDWSRTQTSKIRFNPKSFDFISEINEVKQLFNDTALQKSLTIEIKSQENLQVYADKDMINTVLRNLISNAIKYSQTGGIITISIEKRKNELIVIVADNGIGIQKERIDRLFTVIDNYSTPGTRNEKGTGLGLILCKEFIEKHHGNIWVESKLGIGSSFGFSLPLSTQSK